MGDTGKLESTFNVPRMDCPSEENMIRMALQDVEGVQALTFDLADRKLTVVHRVPAQEMLERLKPLGLGATLAASRSVGSDDAQELVPPDDAAEAHRRWRPRRTRRRCRRIHR